MFQRGTEANKAHGLYSNRDVGIVVAKPADLTARGSGSRICTAEVATEAKRADRHCTVARHPAACWARTLTTAWQQGLENMGFTA